MFTRQQIFAVKRLHKILQRLKSIILQDLEPDARNQLKQALIKLDDNYSTQLIDFDQYKIKTISLLCSYRPLHWTEQFLYREAGNFLTQAEKFEICEQIIN